MEKVAELCYFLLQTTQPGIINDYRLGETESMLNKLKALKNVFVANVMAGINVKYIHQQLANNEIEALKRNSRHQNPKSLIPFGHKIYSQNEEDGIIREIFNRIGVTNRVFVEFGVGNGLENNTLALLFDNWSGLWIEASSKSVCKMKKALRNARNKGRLSIIEAFVTKSNINSLISSSIIDKEIDLLSIDVDGNDVHVFNSITCIKPRVVVIEYNAKFPPPILFCMEYDESYRWKGDDCFGASLKYLENNFAKKGYNLVGCNLTGTNAFFVREDLTRDKFVEPYSAENHYEPARYYLGGFSSGHPSSYEALEKSLTTRST